MKQTFILIAFVLLMSCNDSSKNITETVQTTNDTIEIIQTERDLGVGRHNILKIWDFGNVKVRIITDYEYERINKVFLIGQLAEVLAKQLNYSEPIFLDFNHGYTYYYKTHYNPKYFISYDKCKIRYAWSDEKESQFFLKENSIVIRQYDKQFDAQTTLKLLEYAILNIENIKSQQKETVYDEIFLINSIDSALIKKMLKKPNSILVNNILKIRFDRPEEDIEFTASYYLQNNKYTVFSRKGDAETNRIISTNLITLDNIYDWKKINYDYCHSYKFMIFDTDGSFYFIDPYREQVSKRHIIPNANYYDYPFNVAYIGWNKILIYFRYEIEEEEGKWKIIEKTLIYLREEDELIEINIDELIKNNEK